MVPRLGLRVVPPDADRTPPQRLRLAVGPVVRDRCSIVYSVWARRVSAEARATPDLRVASDVWQL